MTGEDTILQELVNGRKSKYDIPISSTQRSRIGNRLLGKGIVKQDESNSWELTKEGFKYAIDKGFNPPTKPYYNDMMTATDFPPIVPRSEYQHEDSLIIYFLNCLVIGLVLAAFLVLMMKWTHYIP
jgi:hypothetical protein